MEIVHWLTSPIIDGIIFWWLCLFALLPLGVLLCFECRGSIGTSRSSVLIHRLGFVDSSAVSISYIRGILLHNVIFYISAERGGESPWHACRTGNVVFVSVGGTRFPGRPEAFAGDAGGAVSVELVTARPGPPVSSCVLPYNVPSACWGRGGVPNSFNASLPTRTLRLVGHL